MLCARECVSVLQHDTAVTANRSLETPSFYFVKQPLRELQRALLPPTE